MAELQRAWKAKRRRLRRRWQRKGDVLDARRLTLLFSGIEEVRRVRSLFPTIAVSSRRSRTGGARGLLLLLAIQLLRVALLIELGILCLVFGRMLDDGEAYGGQKILI